jgi:hypothetical protein
MSRNYSMTVIVSSYDPEKATAIREAANEEWSFEDWHEDPPEAQRRQLMGWGDGKLCAGEGEEEFVHRLAKAIWKANGAYCDIEVQSVFLDDLPNEVYELDEDAYDRLMESETVPNTPSQG